MSEAIIGAYVLQSLSWHTYLNLKLRQENPEYLRYRQSGGTWYKGRARTTYVRDYNQYQYY